MISSPSMVATVRRHGVTDKRVLEAVAGVDRALFVPQQWQELAYADQPIPIGFSQTISQPYTVARMCELLIEPLGNGVGRLDKVLEIGTGSGWQTTILSRLFDQVYSVEIIGGLARQTKLENVEIKIGDGKLGWPHHAPYRAIIVAADAQEVPLALIDQLAENGRIVIPVRGEMQRGIKINGQMQWESFGSFSFVPLV